MTKFITPTAEDLKKSGINFGLVTAGLLAAHAVKVVVLTPKEDGTKAMVEDGLMVNGAGVVIGFAGAVLARANKSELGEMAGLGFGLYYLLRVATKAADSMKDSLSGDGTGNSVKAALKKWVPALSGMGEVAPSDMPIPSYAIPTQRLLPEAYSQRNLAGNGMGAIGAQGQAMFA